jgi:type II secretory pathway component PulM
VLAALFFLLSLALAYTATRRPAEEGGGVIDVIRNQQQQQQQVPAPSQKPAADVPKPEAQTPSAAPAQTPGAAPAQTPSDKQVPQ